MAEEQQLICVRTCQGWDLAQIYKSKLEAAEIPVLLEYESAGLVFGITIDGLGQVRVMVPQPYSEEAKALLEDVEEGYPEGPDAVREQPSSQEDPGHSGIEPDKI
jgi:hypothetical protein